MSKYEGTIPDFAVAHAVALKKACPSAQFEVDALTRDDRYAHRLEFMNDPFLVMKIGEGSYYIDVWGEDVFEGRSSS